MHRPLSWLANRCADALAAILAPVLPLVVLLLGATPVLPTVATWAIGLPALLAALLVLGNPRRRRARTRTHTIATRTAHVILD